MYTLVVSWSISLRYPHCILVPPAVQHPLCSPTCLTFLLPALFFPTPYSLFSPSPYNIAAFFFPDAASILLHSPSLCSWLGQRPRGTQGTHVCMCGGWGKAEEHPPSWASRDPCCDPGRWGVQGKCCPAVIFGVFSTAVSLHRPVICLSKVFLNVIITVPGTDPSKQKCVWCHFCYFSSIPF